MENQRVDKIQNDVIALAEVIGQLTDRLEHDSEELNLVATASKLLDKISQNLPERIEDHSENHQSSMEDVLPHLIVIVDRQGTILSHNQINDQDQPSSATGKLTIFDFFSPNYQSQISDALNLAFHEGRAGGFESYAPREQSWFQNYIGPLVEEGKVTSAMLVSRDITQLKRIERMQRDSEQRFRRYFDLSLVGIAITSPQKSWVEVNDRLCEIFGYKREVLTQKTWGEITHPEDLARDVYQFERVMRNEIDGYSMDKRFIRGDGQVIHASIDVKCLRDSQGEVDCFVAMVQDITHRIEAEHQLRIQHEQLAHAGRISTMAEMVSGLAHEINQPLSAIELSCFAAGNLLGSSEFSQSQLRSVLSSIEQQASRAGEVVQRVRGFIRKEDSIRTAVNLFELIQEVILFVEHDVRISQTQVNSSLDESVPHTNADPIQLQQVLVNLVRNAIDAMSNTPVENRVVHICLRSISDRGVEVAVSDNGVGVDIHDLEELFQAFFTTKDHGLGMGLAISRSIIQDHGGELCAECNEEQGMTFRFTLPSVGSDLAKAV